MAKPSMKDTVDSATEAFVKPIAPGSRAIYSRDGTRVITIPARDPAPSHDGDADDFTAESDEYTAGQDIVFEYDNKKKTRRGARGKKKAKSLKTGAGGTNDENNDGSVVFEQSGQKITVRDVNVRSAKALATATSTAVARASSSSSSHLNAQDPSSNKDKIWDTSSEEERLRIKEFWKQLSEDERRALVRIDKGAILQKMKEQQRIACSCPVCGRKRMAIEEELESLCDTYQPELGELGMDDNTPSPLPPPRRGSLPQQQQPPPQQQQQQQEQQTQSPPPPPPPKVNFGSSLLFQGGILTVADDLIKNDGKKFIDVMEKLSSRCFEPGAVDAFDDDYEAYGDGDEDENYNDEEDDEEYDDEDYEEDYESEEYDSESDQSLFSKNQGSAPTSHPSGVRSSKGHEMSSEERAMEGRKMLQVFAARMFEQRVLNAYREKVAQERQQRLLEELEEESRLEEEREQRRLAEKEKKKDKKRLAKLAKEEEQARIAAEKARLEAEAAEKARLKRELKARKAEEERQKKEEAERKKREKRQQKEEERLKKIQLEEERAKKKEEELRLQKEEQLRISEKEKQRAAQEQQRALEEQMLKEREQLAQEQRRLEQEVLQKRQLEESQRLAKEQEAIEERQNQQAAAQREHQLKLLRALQSPSPTAQLQSPRSTNPLSSPPAGTNRSAYLMNSLLNPNQQYESQTMPTPIHQRSISGYSGILPGPSSLGSIGSAHNPANMSPISRQASLAASHSEVGSPVDEVTRLMGSRSLLDDTPSYHSHQNNRPRQVSIQDFSACHVQSPTKSIFSPPWSSRNMWSANVGVSTPTTPLGNKPATIAAHHFNDIKRESVIAYNHFIQDGWTVDGFVPAQVLYHETLKRLGASYALSQADFFEAIGVDNIAQTDGFEAKRDNVGLITHVRHSPTQLADIAISPIARLQPASPWAIHSGV